MTLKAEVDSLRRVHWRHVESGKFAKTPLFYKEHPLKVDRQGRLHDVKTGRFVKKLEAPKVITVKNNYFCFVKGYMTRKGRSRAWHWEATSVDVWLEFVVSDWDLPLVPSDREIIKKAEEFIDGHVDHPWIKSLKHGGEWGVEQEKTEDACTWPYGHVTARRTPVKKGQKKLINRERVLLG